jgi:hypothetical protein
MAQCSVEKNMRLTLAVMSSRFLVILLLCISLIMQGCGGGSTSPAGTNPGLPSAISVTIQPSAAQVVAGKTQIFQASVTGSSDTTVNWNLQEGPSGGSVTSTGIYSAPFSSGAYHIIASSRADPTKSAIATITVPTEAPAVSSVTPFAALMGVGSVTVSVIGSNFFPTSVVNFNGSALATTYDSSTTLTAVIPSFDLTQASINTLSVSNPTLGGGVSGLLEFSVVDPAQISVVVSPRNVNVPVGKTKTFAASVIGSPDTTVSWSINGDSWWQQHCRNDYPKWRIHCSSGCAPWKLRFSDGNEFA